MSDQYVGEIRVFGFNFAPVGWAQCNGQLLPISQNTALFSLLGTNFGGNGTSNFGLPNLQGCVALDAGQGTGLSDYAIGETAGAATVTLTGQMLPSHTHGLNATAAEATTESPGGNMLGIVVTGAGREQLAGNIYSTSAPNTTLAPASLATTGGSQAHNNLQPYLTLNFCIALTGIFPPRS